MSEVHFLAPGIVMLFVSLIGIVANLYVLVSVVRRKTFRTSFFFLCGSKAAFNFITCFTFTTWCVPVAIGGEYWLPDVISMWIGNLIGGSIYMGGVFMQLLSSINRIIAAFSLYVYKKYCGLRTTMILNILTWIFVFSLAIVYYQLGRFYIFDKDYLVWRMVVETETVYETTPTENKGNETASEDGTEPLAGYIVYICTILMFAINAVTFTKLIKDTISNSVLSDKEARKRMKRNRVIFAQKISQDSLYLVDIFTASVLSQLNTSWWWLFATNSLVWLTINTIDGIVMIIFSKELLDPLKKFVKMIKFRRTDNRELFVRKRRTVSAISNPHS